MYTLPASKKEGETNEQAGHTTFCLVVSSKVWMTYSLFRLLMLSTSSDLMSPYFWNKSITCICYVCECVFDFKWGALYFCCGERDSSCRAVTSYASLMRSLMSTRWAARSLVPTGACCTVAGRGLSLLVTLSKNLPQPKTDNTDDTTAYPHNSITTTINRLK